MRRHAAMAGSAGPSAARAAPVRAAGLAARPAWQLHEPAPAPLVEQLCTEAGLHPLTAHLLARRGVTTPAAAQRFLNPSLEHLHDPFLLAGMEDAVTCILAALERGARIVVSGDYDVDGVTSSALLTHFLRGAGCRDLDFFVPNRFQHGYGLTPRTVDALLELRPALVITVDNGITALAEVERLRQSGVETVVTDHHLPRAEGVPPGIVVNPVQPGCAYPFKAISGCGVTLKLVTALRKRLRERGWWSPQRPEPNLKEYLDLVAIGTVADVVPLTEENRVLVHAGLQVLNRAQRRPGVAALLAVSRVERAVTARTIGFQLGPRLNAAGRMLDGSLGVELLLAQDPGRALELAQQLDQANVERRATGDEMFKEALRLIGTPEPDAAALVVASPRFHEGIIGIVASRLMERFGRPALVLAENGAAWKGSARSVPGINVTQAIATGAELLQEFGGHAGAAGCKLPQEHLEAFRGKFVQACAEQQGGAAPPPVLLEARLRPGDVSPELGEQLARMEPCGQGNEEPTFLVEAADLPPPRTMGKDGKHVKWALDGGAEMVGWNLAAQLPAAGGLRFRVRVGINEFGGQRKVQLTVAETQPSL